MCPSKLPITETETDADLINQLFLEKEMSLTLFFNRTMVWENIFGTLDKNIILELIANTALFLEQEPI